MTTELDEIKKSVTDIGAAWETVKKTLDQRDLEVKTMGKAQVDTLTKLNKANDDITVLLGQKDNWEKALKDATETKGRLESLEIAFKRGGGAGKGDDGHSPELKIAKGAFARYIRKCDTKALDELIEKKALSVGSDPDGGYFVTPDTSGRIVKAIYESSPMRQLANVITISTDALEGRTDLQQTEVGWVAETEARPATDTPQVGKYRIPVHEQYAKPTATQKLLEDSAIDVEAWIGDKIADRFARSENTAFVSGNGVGKPKGFLDYATGTTWGTIQRQLTGAAITADNIINLMYLLKQEYSRNAKFVMTRTSEGLVRLLKDSQNRYLWAPSFEANMPATLLGYQVIQFADMEQVALGSGADVIGYGDFREAYQIVDRLGISMLRDPYSSKPLVEFYARKRVGGDVINFEAIKLLQIT